MVYQTTSLAALRFLFETFEQAIGLGALLALFGSVDLFSIELAAALFLLVVLLRLPNVITEFRRIRSQRLQVAEGVLQVNYGDQSIRSLPLADVHALLYKTYRGQVSELKLYADQQTLKLRHVEQMNRLFEEIQPFIPYRKKVRWWQFL
ncbi:hypothetical protein [Marinobacterium arenosum]|uniref:hypothetical protein n=1 Tax=Marinobacterium arenosum TaxID=2862496 RepID=UPI001C9770CF|nr:hypothetical protein [Marinobacterium arenosum]MBY4675721.1 hypothetical protein [Marinobacterium arenosum]